MKRVLLIGGIALSLMAVLVVGLFLGIMVTPARAQISQAIGQVLHNVRANIPEQIALAAQTQPQLQLKDEKGVLVAGIFVGSPADKAGLVRGDIILDVDGKEVNTYADLRSVLSSHKAGDTIKLSVQHGDAQKSISVTLAQPPMTSQSTQQNNTPNNGAQTPAPNTPKNQVSSLPFLGIVPSEAGAGKGFNFFKQPGQPGVNQAGAVIEQVASGSPAEKAGLKEGDVIVSVDGTAIDAQNSLQSLLAKHKPGDTVKLQVTSGTTTNGATLTPRDVTVTLGDNPNAAGTAWLGVSIGFSGGRFHRGFGGGFQGMMHPGAIIQSVTAGSPAEKAGLKAGQFIEAVDGKTITSAQDLSTIIGGHKPGDTVTLTVFNVGNTTTSTDVKVTLGQNPQNASAAWLGIQFSFIDMQPGQQPAQPSQNLPQG